MVHIFAVAVLILWGMQAAAISYGFQFDASAVLQHLILSFTFLVFFPGQTFWSYRVTTEDGHSLLIVGTDREACEQLDD